MVNAVLILDGAPWLDYRGDSGFMGQIHTVWEWEKCIRRHHGSCQVEPVSLGLDDRLFQRIYATGLSRSAGEELSVFREDDGV